MSNLRYFDAQDFAAEKALEAATKSDETAKVAAWSHTRWLMGETAVRTKEEIEAAIPKGHVARKKYLDAEQVKEKTKQRLSAGAEATYKTFNNGMPQGHQLRTCDIVPTLLEAYPHLGVCQYAQASIKTAGGPCFVAMYVANFNATIRMNGKDDFFKLASPNYDQMYFGIAWRQLEGTDTMVVASDVGVGGLMYQTNDRSKAFDNTMRLVTGQSVAMWKEKMRVAEERLNQANIAALTPSFGR